MLIFKKDTHQYFVDDQQYASVTTVLGTYKKPFNTDFWSTYKALEKLIGKEDFATMKRHRNFKSPAFIEWACNFVDTSELLLEIDFFKQKWDKEREASLFKGNTYHDAKERQAYSKGYETNPFTDKRIPTMMKKPSPGNKKSGTSNLYDLPDGYYPELMIWNNLYKIAGTADKVFIKTLRGVRYVDVDDYKTNKEIKKTNPYDKMKFPLNKLDDCNYNHYRLQICTYAWMLEQFGFKVRYTAFTHLNHQYKISYGHGKKYVKSMLDHYTKVKLG